MLHRLLLFLLTIPNGFSDSRYKCLNKKNNGDLNSFLWTVKRDPPSYFFGTIHVPYTKVWDYIPHSTKEAFHQSDNIFFELDLTDVYTISALANCQLLPKGENLADVLPPDIYNRLKRHLDYVRQKMRVWMSKEQRGKGVYADFLFNAIAGNWERKRPVWVMLMVNSLTENDVKSRGTPVLDLYLAQEAEKVGKVTGAIERVEEQCVPLNELNFSQVLFALNQTLWQHEIYRSQEDRVHFTTEELIFHYNCGNLNTVILNKSSARVPNLVNNSLNLPLEAMETARMIDEYFRLELIIKRNQRMAERVINLLKAHPRKSFFFAFGAGHYLGNDTILDRLKDEGYDIEYLPANSVIPKNENIHKHRKHHRKKAKNMSFPNYESFGDFWLQIDADADYRVWLEKREKHRKRLYNRYKEKPFNDLWIKMDDDRLMSQLAEQYVLSTTEKKINRETNQDSGGNYHSANNHGNQLSHYSHLVWVWPVLIVIRHFVLHSIGPEVFHSLEL